MKRIISTLITSIVLSLSFFCPKDFIEDYKDPAFKEAVDNDPDLIGPWERLATLSGDSKTWTRKSVPLLKKMKGESEDFQSKVAKYYSSHQKPANMGDPPFVHEGTAFDDFGHPNFVPDVPNMAGGHGKIKYRPGDIDGQPALKGTGTDMNRANAWAKNKFNTNSELNFKEHPDVAGRCLIKDSNSPYANAEGWVDCVWHHHEDAETMIPVPIQMHNRSFPTGSPHTGGAAILKKPELHDLIGFFNSPSGI